MLPEQRQPGAYRIALVCLGNICRSPMADVVLSDLVAKAGLSGRVHVDSAGTADWHVGKPMDQRAAATLTAAGYDASRHRAQHFDASWHPAYDLILVMDRSNQTDVRALGGDDDRVRMFREFDPVQPGDEVPDPYYGGDDGFEEVLTMVERTCAALLSTLERERALR